MASAGLPSILIEELTPAESIKFFKLVDHMVEVLDAAEVAAASTSAAAPASHEDVASVVGSAAFAFFDAVSQSRNYE